jgi:hypothetical protein
LISSTTNKQTNKQNTPHIQAHLWEFRSLRLKKRFHTLCVYVCLFVRERTCAGDWTGASQILSKCSTTELHPQPNPKHFYKEKGIKQT